MTTQADWIAELTKVRGECESEEAFIARFATVLVKTDLLVSELEESNSTLKAELLALKQKHTSAISILMTGED